jgi:bisphosphoglycerate-independent phosphoglycerate mutase (AlkP superfamily)
MMRPIAGRMARSLGFGTFRFRGSGAVEVVATARPQLASQTRGLIVFHWPDADRAGHEHGWMSPQYGEAAVALDTALGQLMRAVDLTDPSTMLVALADHGGGGRQLRHHDSDHPLDRTIPIIFAGGAVRPGALNPQRRLIDVPATVLSVLGLPVPESYGGVSMALPRVRTDAAAAEVVEAAA